MRQKLIICTNFRFNSFFFLTHLQCYDSLSHYWDPKTDVCVGIVRYDTVRSNVEYMMTACAKNNDETYIPFLPQAVLPWRLVEDALKSAPLMGNSNILLSHPRRFFSAKNSHWGQLLHHPSLLHSDSLGFSSMLPIQVDNLGGWRLLLCISSRQQCSRYRNLLIHLPTKHPEESAKNRVPEVLDCAGKPLWVVDVVCRESRPSDQEVVGLYPTEFWCRHLQLNQITTV